MRNEVGNLHCKRIPMGRISVSRFKGKKQGAEKGGTRDGAKVEISVACEQKQKVSKNPEPHSRD